MISTGVIADMHDITTLRRIQNYYAAVGREMHFEVALEQKRDKLIDAEREVGISPVRPMTVDQLSSAFAANPKLLATAENYWLYTNHHLKRRVSCKFKPGGSLSIFRPVLESAGANVCFGSNAGLLPTRSGWKLWRFQIPFPSVARSFSRPWLSWHGRSVP